MPQKNAAFFAFGLVVLWHLLEAIFKNQIIDDSIASHSVYIAANSDV